MRFLIFLITVVFVFAKDITLQFNWLPQFEFAGYIVAKEKGFYKKEGLNVKFLYYNPKITVMNAVKSKKADFGIEEIDIFKKYLKGEPFKAVAAIFQDSPHALMAIREYNITDLYDLKNKKLSLKYGKKIPVGIQLMLLSNGLKLSDFKLYPVTFDINDLINKKYDAITVYISNEPFLLRQKGYTPVIFSPKDYGFHFYSGIIFTTNEYLSNNPETVRKFVKATLKGWKWAFSHIDETVDLIYNKYNLLHNSKEALKYEANVLKKLAGENIGEISENRLEEISNYYKILGLKVKKDVKGFVYNPSKVYLSKKEKEYLQKHKVFNVCIDPTWPPIEYVEDGKPKGIAQDVLKIAANKLNVKFNIIKTDSWKESMKLFKKGKCQLLAEAVKTKKREKFAYFTKPYLRYKMVFITRENHFINSISEVLDKILARQEESALIELLKQKYPNIKILKTKTTLDAFKAVAKGRAYYTLAILPVASYINYKYLLNLQVSGYSDINYNISMAVNKKYPYLYSAISKALDTIKPNEIKSITQKYMYAVISKVDYKLVIGVIASFFIIAVFFYYRHILLKKMNKRLKDEVKKAVTEKLKAIYEDNITGCFTKAKMSVDKNSEKYAIILNIRNFSKINSVYGFFVGDEVLRTVCKELKEIKQNVYRLDADEFIIFSNDYKKDIEKIKEAFNKEIKINNLYFKLSFYFGVAENNEDILRHLTVALKTAKKNLSDYFVFKKEEEKEFEDFFKFNDYLLKAIHNKEGYSIEPYFQGIYSYKNKKIVKYEALARLIVKERVYTPYYFIDIAKTSGFITDLTNIMIEKSMKAAKEYGFDVSINLTEEDFLRDDLIDFLYDKTKKYDLKPSSVTFEILENIANKQMNIINDKLKILKKLGFKIAIDDFGVENSNFEKIAVLEIDYVKIDAKFIKNICHDEKSRILVESIVYFAHKLNIEVVAEFVENKEIDNILKELNIDLAQGYFYSKPHKKGE